MGLAYFSIEKYENAARAYETGLSLDPTNDNLKSFLDAARKKLAPVAASSKASAHHAHIGGCCPGDDAVDVMSGMGAGGMPGGMDFASLINIAPNL
jgi:hypothetical protein